MRNQIRCHAARRRGGDKVTRAIWPAHSPGPKSTLDTASMAAETARPADPVRERRHVRRADECECAVQMDNCFTAGNCRIRMAWMPSTANFIFIIDRRAKESGPRGPPGGAGQSVGSPPNALPLLWSVASFAWLRLLSVC